MFTPTLTSHFRPPLPWALAGHPGTLAVLNAQEPSIMIWTESIDDQVRTRSAHRHLYQRDVEKVVNAILGEITAALARGGRVELRGFGVFSVRARAARPGRNPRTGASVSIAPKAWAFFKVGRKMHARLNRSGG